jgi:LmbE family N-acetylglucosaminyl deacetylase
MTQAIGSFWIVIVFVLKVNSLVAQNDAAKVILAIFAHPDDEMTVGPMLAKYAREGASVYVVSVTDGRYGVGQSGLEAGDELVALRKEEFNCSTSKLGAEPIWLGYHDQLRLREGYDGHVPLTQRLIREVDSLVTVLQPDVLITWGPDGGTNHMDHRLVGATVTQVFISKDWNKPRALYYYATPSHLIEDESERILRGVDEKYLTMRVSYTEDDLNKALEAFSCYQSQFSPEQMKELTSYIKSFDYQTYLRPFAASTQMKEDLFQ